MARTEKYLPQGSKLVIRAGQTPAAWYETKKEVILTTTPVETDCPITGERVVTATEQKVQIWFQPRMIRSRVVLEDGDVDEATFNEQFCLFHYDVPTAGGYANPSSKLYPIAVRLTESAWMMRVSDIPYSLMADMQDNGCSVEVNNFDQKESRRLIHQAVAKLQEELAEAVKRANASRDRAEAALEASQNPAEGEAAVSPEEAERRYTRQAEAIEKRLTLLAAQLGKAATRFGINERAVNINRLGATASAIGFAMRERAQAYASSARILAQQTDATSQALAQASQQDAVPAYAMADAMREAGEDEAADRLQKAFDESEPETFSLAGVGDEE